MHEFSKIATVSKLTKNPLLHSYTDVHPVFNLLPRPSVAPEKAGVYAWYFKNIEDASGRIYGPYYVGESINLRARIKEHCTSSQNSPMRKKLDTRIHGVMGLFQGVNEERLNFWMRINAFVSWIETNEHKELEKYIIGQVNPIFNVEYNSRYSGFLSGAR